MTVVARLGYLRIVLVLAGLACLALYPLMLFLAVRLGLARRSLRLPDDDRWHLRHTGRVLDPGRT